MFKRKAKSLEVIDNPKPVIHKQTKKLVQHIITIHDDGETYKLFEFCEVYDMPAQRWVMYDNLLEDRNRGVSRAELAEGLEEMEKAIEANSMKAIAECLVLIRWFKTRVNIERDVDLVMRWISTAIFFEDEDVRVYDWDIGTRKIDLITKHGLDAFFLSSPMARYWKPVTISSTDMESLKNLKSAKEASYKELKQIVSLISIPLYDKKGTPNT